MARFNRFVFLVDKNERRMIAEMAQRLQRKDADAVRFVVLEAARALESDTTQAETPKPVIDGWGRVIGGNHDNG